MTYLQWTQRRNAGVQQRPLSIDIKVKGLVSWWRRDDSYSSYLSGRRRTKPPPRLSRPRRCRRTRNYMTPTACNSYLSVSLSE
jgi:hypothetical protein